MIWFRLIFVEIFHDLADFLLPGSVSVSLKRIRLIKMKRIQTDPDPKHCKISSWSELWPYIRPKANKSQHWTSSKKINQTKNRGLEYQNKKLNRTAREIKTFIKKNLQSNMNVSNIGRRAVSQTSIKYRGRNS